MSAVVEARPDVVFVCSPNNPTGNAQPVAAVASLAGRTDALVIVDEAYIEFGGSTCLPLVTDHPNVVVTRTMSKAFALAGARIGYALASPEVVEDLQRVRLPYHLSAHHAGGRRGGAPSRQGGRRDPGRDPRRARPDPPALRAMPDMTVFPSDANFVLFVPPKPAADVWRGLLERGVLIRDLSSVVPNALRVTAGNNRGGRPVLEEPRGGSRHVTDAARRATVNRTTKETDVRVELSLDGSGTGIADTGLPFFDHMLQQLGTHSGWDLEVNAKGDLQIDGHHTVEDVGIALGQALADALGDKKGIRRFASITVPLDEAAVEVALDLSGRPFVVHEVDIPAEMIGTFDTGLVEDFVRAFATTSQMTLHVRSAVGTLAPPRGRGRVQGAWRRRSVTHAA